MATKSNKTPRQRDSEQGRRFIEAARELGVDPNADVDEVMRRLAEQKPSPRRPPDQKDDRKR